MSLNELVVIPQRASISKRLATIVRQQPVGVVGFFLVILLLLIVAFGPIVSQQSPDILTANMLALPFGDSWFGTDERGRDYFARVMEGGRVTVLLSFFALLTGTVAGTFVGMISAYSRKIDLIVQRFVDAMLALPGLFLILLFITVFGTDLVVLVFTIGFVTSPAISRIARGVTLATLTNPYIESAEVAGASWIRILLRHVLPNILPTLGVIFSVGLGNVMLLMGGLGFLGLGVQPPQAEWGQMISESRAYFSMRPWLFLFPGLGLALAVLGINLLGDSLRDLWDPRMRGSL